MFLRSYYYKLYQLEAPNTKKESNFQLINTVNNFFFLIYGKEIHKRRWLKISEKLWGKVARNFVNAGGIPIPISDNIIKIIQTLITEEQANFLQIFRKRSLTFDQIKAKSYLDDNAINKMLNELIDNGIIMGIPSSTGIMIYYLVSILPGLLEFPFMKGEKGEKQKTLARLMDTLFDELSHLTQSNYDMVINQFRSANPMDRVVPVEIEIDVPQEIVMPYEEVKGIIERNDIISVNYCYCRNWKDNLNDPCKLETPLLNCFQFGKYAQSLIDHNFGKAISKEETIKILKESENAGLVHKAIHLKNPEQEEQAFCNCCSCCCQFFQLYQRGIFPFHTLTYYMANLEQDKCIGCGTCVEKCAVDAIELIDDLSVTSLDKCIGCGLCVHHCPENARNLERTGIREVFIAPPKLNPL
ncbi:MAG: ATP-binding protein [Candidatus Hodarchaeota archaeon]